MHKGVCINVSTPVFRNFGLAFGNFGTVFRIFRIFGLLRTVRGTRGAKTCEAVVPADCGVCVPVYSFFGLSRISGVKICEVVVLAESGTSSRILQGQLEVTSIAEAWESNSYSSRLLSSTIDA
jgi:hypothetical protein